jgi:hypothetical protein
MSTPGDSAQPRATLSSPAAKATDPPPARVASTAPAERLEWQGELDSVMADIDTRLQHPRRRATDVTAQPTLPQLGQVDITSELLDEIAWRVSEQLRRSPAGEGAAAGAPAARPAARPVARAAAPLPPPPEPEPEPMPHGVAISIRIRKPLFRFRFWRRRVRRKSLISFADYRIT